MTMSNPMDDDDNRLRLNGESKSIHDAVTNDSIVATDHYLTTAKVGVNARNSSNGDSPLHIAARHGRDAIARMLLHRGANIDQRNKNGFTPLHSASAAGSLQLVALLWAKGADIEARDRYGYAALHHAARNGRFACCRFLVDCGCDVRKESWTGLTAENLAAAKGFHVLGRMLKREAERRRWERLKARAHLRLGVLRRAEDLSGGTFGHLAVGQRCGHGAGPDGEMEWSYEVFCSECRKFVRLGTSQVKAGACCPARSRSPEVALRRQALSHPFRQKELAQ